MVETKSLLTTEVKKSEVVAYFLEYLKNHTYIKSKSITINYLVDYDLHTLDADQIRKLKLQFSKAIFIALKNHYLIKYNNKTYKTTKHINYKDLEFKLVRNMKKITVTIG